METTTSNPAPLTRQARAHLRLTLAALDLAGFVLPLVGAVAAGWLADRGLADNVTGLTRTTYVVVLAVAACAAVDRNLGAALAARYRTLYGRLNGRRTWSCENCAATITASHWTPGEAAAYEQLLADPNAHLCK